MNAQLFAEAVSFCGVETAAASSHPLHFALGGAIDVGLCLAVLLVCRLLCDRRGRARRRGREDCGT